MLGGINWLAVVLAMVGAMVTGFVWYSPPLFVKPWMRELGKSPEQMGNPAKSMATAVILHLITATCMAFLFRQLEVQSVPDAIATATLLWVGFSGATQFATDRFQGATVKLSLIVGGHALVTFWVMGAILVLMA